MGSGLVRRPLFEWHDAVLSARGPREPIKRLVLIALWKFANSNLDAYPGEAAIAVRAGVTERTVGTHLKSAVTEGWIQRQLKRRRGKAWNHYVYKLTLPECVPDLRAPIAEQKIAA